MRAKKLSKSLKFENKPKAVPAEQQEHKSRDIGDQPRVKSGFKEGEEAKQEDPEVKNSEPDVPNLSKYQDLLMQSQYDGLGSGDREKLEKELDPIDFSDVFHGEVRQEVPIGPVSVVFRALSLQDTLDLQENAGPPMLNERETNLKFLAYKLCLQVYAVAGNVLPGYRNNSGEWDESAFKKRFKKISSLPWETIQWIDMQRRWFEERLRSVYTTKAGVEQLKNG